MSCKERSDGAAVIRWRDKAGVHRKKTITPKMEPDPRKRRKLAKEYEARKLQEVKLGLPQVTDERKTLGDVMHEGFISTVIEQKAPKTQALYKSLWNAHLGPAFENLPASQIEASDIEDWLAEAEVGVVTKRKALVLLGQIMRYAQKRKWAIYNPCDLVDKPRLPATEPVNPPPPLEVERIRNAFFDLDKPLGAIFASVVAYAGLRPFGEALALTRGDVRDRTLLVRDRKRNRVRTADILSPLREDLDWWLAQTTAFPAAPLFPNGKGDFWTLSQYENWRGRDVWPKVADFPPKNLRHTYVSLLIRDESYSRREIADMAGHSVEVQDSVYSHVWAELRGTGSAEDAIREARRQVFQVSQHGTKEAANG